MTETPIMSIVRARSSGKVHVSVDGVTTVCGSTISADRMPLVARTTEWHLSTDCYNCAYRLGVPPGFVQPRNSKDFPIRRKCPHGSDEKVCTTCTPTHPPGWSCPNGCTDPKDHSPTHRYTRCTVYPPQRETGPDDRCVDPCVSIQNAMHWANPGLYFDLADSAMTTCYHCGGDLCILCGGRAREGDTLCGTC